MKFSVAALIASLCLVVSVAGQSSSPATPSANDKPNELNFNGNGQDQSVTPTDDTTIIDDKNNNQNDNVRPNIQPNNNFNQHQHQQNPSTDIEQYDDGRQHGNDFFQNFGFGGGFGGGDMNGNGFGGGFGGPLIRPNPGSLLSQLLGGGLFDSLRRHEETFDKQFEQLRKQAIEGQEVNYFNRNGVAYVRTCTTKRVDKQQQQQ